MKTCSKCKQNLPLTEFNKKSNRKDGLQPFCRECNRARSRQYYAENRDKHLSVVSKRKIEQIAKANAFVADFLSEKNCADCEEKNILVLEFDHIFGDKRNNICTMIGNGYSVDSIKEEISKCEVVCRNCHSIRTHRRGNTFKWRYLQERASLTETGS
jgi:hypothetical protein